MLTLVGLVLLIVISPSNVGDGDMVYGTESVLSIEVSSLQSVLIREVSL